MNPHMLTPGRWAVENGKTLFAALRALDSDMVPAAIPVMHAGPRSRISWVVPQGTPWPSFDPPPGYVTVPQWCRLHGKRPSQFYTMKSELKKRGVEIDFILRVPTLWGRKMRAMVHRDHPWPLAKDLRRKAA